MERAYVAELADRVGIDRDRVVNLAGKLSLGGLFALLDGARYIVTNDTGPMHMALALETPTVALFGPSDPAQYGWVGPGVRMVYKPIYCSPCVHEVSEPPCRGNNVCMWRITVEDVLEAIDQVRNSADAGASDEGLPRSFFVEPRQAPLGCVVRPASGQMTPAAARGMRLPIVRRASRDRPGRVPHVSEASTWPRRDGYPGPSTTMTTAPPLAGARWGAGGHNRVNLIVELHRNRFANALVKVLQISRVVDVYLDRFLIRRTTPSGVVYWVESVPSLVVANEIFATDDYMKPVSRVRPRTIVDLGANVGYFPLLVAEITGSRTIEGLCIEPNPQLHRRIERHLEANGLSGVHLLKGLVAGDDAGPEADFFLSPSHIASTLTGEFSPRLPPRGRIRKIRVPVLDPAGEWHRRFGDRRIDLIKIDIEGAELLFLKAHRSFLSRTDAILLEWHTWVTTLEEILSLLVPLGFALESVGKVDTNAGTALFRRKDEATADVAPS